jgi:hypothetical protein
MIQESGKSRNTIGFGLVKTPLEAVSRRIWCLMSDFGTKWPILGPVDAFNTLKISESELVPRLLLPTGMTVLIEFSEISLVRLPGGSQPSLVEPDGLKRERALRTPGGFPTRAFLCPVGSMGDLYGVAHRVAGSRLAPIWSYRRDASPERGSGMEGALRSRFSRQPGRPSAMTGEDACPPFGASKLLRRARRAGGLRIVD